MKIAYIGGFSKIYDEEGIAKTFEALGHTVYRYAEVGYSASDTEDIIRKKPDIVLFAKLKIELGLRYPLLDACKENGITTVCWVPDLYFGIGRQMLVDKDPIFRADFVFTPDGGHDEEWKKHRVNHHLLRQGIYEPDCYIGSPLPLSFEIVFIGSNNPEFPYRTKLMDMLSLRYSGMFRWLGKTSDDIRRDDLNKLFASVKVVIGDSVYSPKYWSNRVYETLGRGGFMIHPRIEGLDEEFTYYKHLVPYDYGDFDGLFEKIEYYLTHDREREYIRQEGFTFTKETHTLKQRCQELLNLLKSVS